MAETRIPPATARPDERPPTGAAASMEVIQHGVLGQAKRLVKIVIGFTLVGIGALFGLVPLIPGWPLGFLGLSILAAEFVWARRLMKRVRGGSVRLREAALWRPRRPKKPRAAAQG